MINLAPTRLQEGGTCWFHAAMNGFLLSIYGRTFLKNVILNASRRELAEKYKKNRNINQNACPSPQAGRAVLLRFIQTYLTKGIINLNKNKLIAFTGNNTKNMNSGGLSTNQYRIHDRVFTPDERENLVVGPLKFGPIDIEKKEGFTLSHCYIGLRYENGGAHAIAGGIDRNNNFFVYDSNGGVLICDWSTAEGQQDIMNHMSKPVRTLQITATWIRTSALKNENINKTHNNIVRLKDPEVHEIDKIFRNMKTNFESVRSSRIRLGDIIKKNNILKKTKKIINFPHNNLFTKNRERWEQIIKSIVIQAKEFKTLEKNINNIKYNYAYESGGATKVLANIKRKRLAEILPNVVPNSKAQPRPLNENNIKRIEHLYSKLEKKEIDISSVSKNNKQKIYNYLIKTGQNTSLNREFLQKLVTNEININNLPAPKNYEPRPGVLPTRSDGSFIPKHYLRSKTVLPARPDELFKFNGKYATAKNAYKKKPRLNRKVVKENRARGGEKQLQLYQISNRNVNKRYNNNTINNETISKLTSNQLTRLAAKARANSKNNLVVKLTERTPNQKQLNNFFNEETMKKVRSAITLPPGTRSRYGMPINIRVVIERRKDNGLPFNKNKLTTYNKFTSKEKQAILNAFTNNVTKNVLNPKAIKFFKLNPRKNTVSQATPNQKQLNNFFNQKTMKKMKSAITSLRPSKYGMPTNVRVIIEKRKYEKPDFVLNMNKLITGTKFTTEEKQAILNAFTNDVSRQLLNQNAIEFFELNKRPMPAPMPTPMPRRLLPPVTPKTRRTR